ncbi:MAG: heme-binding protein [Polyangiaceae bacterium]|nr:heme-binding protein [Polyangiaceae bacterium]
MVSNSGTFLGRAILGATLFLAGCSVADIEEPQYVTQKRIDSFEIREYGKRVVAETSVAGDWTEAGNEGFRRLAGYIFGGNKGRAKIAMTAPVSQSRQEERSSSVKLAMTAPVAQRREGKDWTVSFMMPAGETIATLPVPDDARVVLRELPPVRVAVVRFSGRWTDANMAEHEQALRTWLKEQKLTPVGEPEVNRYDPPFKPWFMRRNEVWLKLAD